MSTVPQRPAFSSFPLAALAAAFALGITLTRCARPPLTLCLIVGALFSAVSLLAFIRGRLALSASTLLVAFAFAGGALALAESAGVAENRARRFYERGEVVSGEPVEVTGVLERAPEIAPDGLTLTLRVERWRSRNVERAATGRIELFAPASDARARDGYRALELRRGARVRALVALTRAERYRNPGVAPLTEFLEQRDLDARGSIKSCLLVERLDDERVFLPVVWLEEWRARLAALFDRMFSADTSGVLKASLLGNRQGLTRATAERHREGGTFHVLVISGMHITFIGGFVWFWARRLTRSAARQWLIAVSAVWCYTVFVGAEASVTRAAVMFTVVALAPVLGRRSRPLNALGGAALLLLAWRPANLFDPSFQLTFLSVLAIVALALPLLSSLKAVGEWRPTRATPLPPTCPRWWRAIGETLFWSERKQERELARSTHSYRLFKSPLAARLDRRRAQRPLRYVCAATLVSVVVQLTLLPLLVVYFHRLSLAAPLLNIFVGALMVIISFAALAAATLAQLGGGFASPLVWVAEQSNWLMAHSVDPFSAWGVASVRLPEYSGAASALYFVYFLPLLVFMTALGRWSPVSDAPAPVDDALDGREKRQLKLAACVYVALLALVIAHPLSAGWPDGRLRVDFLDVGQGDAALITMPDGTTMLVDGGGRPRFDTRAPFENADGAELFERDARGVGEAVVSEYLWARGLDRVNYALATHADADHIDGLNDVLMNFKVDGALVARAPFADEEFTRFAATAERAGTPIHIIGRGDTFRFGAATIEVLWPPRVADASRAPSRNEASVVLRLRFGERIFLLTGDIERGAEAQLAATTGELKCDVVKVAHHGSRTSSTDSFVNAARPSIAVISVGLDSPYGHPHADVVARWRALGAEPLTTGERGAITISTDGIDLKLETYVKQ